MVRTRTVTLEKYEHDKELWVKKSKNFIKQTKEILDLKNRQRFLEKTASELPDNHILLDELQEVDVKLAKVFTPHKIKYRLKRDDTTATLADELGYRTSKYLARSNSV